MNRTEKIATVERLHEEFERTPHYILASYRGLDVNSSTELRRKVRGAGGRYQVIKNRLAKRAAAGTPMEKLAGGFSGPCALASHESDPVQLAKVLSEFAKANPAVTLVAGILDAHEVMDLEAVKQLATLPGLQELRAQLLALVNTPATMLTRLLQTPAEQMARVVDARATDGDENEGS